LDQEIEVITDGYQKWQGAAPSFSRSAIIRIGVHHDCIGEIDQADSLDKSIRADPTA